jgi:phosphate transport system ATP-binding protein
MARRQIITENLNVRFGRLHVLRGINMEIPEKQITAIIGPSGCGKTTLLRCFSRLVDLTEDVKVTGKVIVDGEDIYAPGVDVIAVRKKMGLLSQRPYPLPMSIFGNVAYGLKIHYRLNRARLHERVQHYLDAVGLWDEVKDRLKEPASMLSIGQQQRLCLARGLAIEPEVILCDEPTSALDPVSAAKIQELLIKLSTDYTIILVTHVLRQAKKIADHAYFIYYGEIIESGVAKELFADPKEKLTQKYIYGDIGY